MTPIPVASCARWHPDLPSDIRLTPGVGSRGKPFQRRHCVLCRELYAKRRHQRDKAALTWEPYGLAMGVVRLSWAAPEMMA